MKVNFWKLESMYAIKPWNFPVCHFSRCCSEWIEITFQLSSSVCNFFPRCLYIQFFCYDLSVPIFCFKIVLLPSNSVAFVYSPPTCQKNFLSLFWNVLFCLYWLVLSWYLFSLPSLANTFWFITSVCIFGSNCVAFLLSSYHILMFFFYLSIFAYCRRFLICVSNLISHQGFDFLFVFSRVTPIFSQTDFAPA